MVRIFQIAAVIFAGIAAFFLWRGNNDGLFVCAVLGATCFFLVIRFEVGARVKERQGEEETWSQEEDEEGDFNDSGSVELLSEPMTTDEERTTNDERRTTNDERTKV